jgi:predicted nuclease of predicted toxin-antitoxin system
LVQLLQDAFPDSAHVVSQGLGAALDEQVFRYAGTHGFVLVTQDRDFAELSAVHGAPPKVVWIRANNGATRPLAELLRRHQAALRALVEDPAKAMLILHQPAP